MFEPVSVSSEHLAYTRGLQEFLAPKLSSNLKAIGNLEILRQPAIALFCSNQCPEDLAQQTYALVKQLRKANIAVISGFHSPVEKVCLHLLLKGTQPIIYCPARSLDTLRLPQDQKTAIEARRLLLLSPFPVSQKRATVALAVRRNRLVGAIATSVFIAYATPQGKTENLASAIARQSKAIFTFNSPDTVNLMQVGVTAMDVNTPHSKLLSDTKADSIKLD